MLKGFMHSF